MMVVMLAQSEIRIPLKLRSQFSVSFASTLLLILKLQCFKGTVHENEFLV